MHPNAGGMLFSVPELRFLFNLPLWKRFFSILWWRTLRPFIVVAAKGGGRASEFSPPFIIFVASVRQSKPSLKRSRVANSPCKKACLSRAGFGLLTDGTRRTKASGTPLKF